MKKRRTIFSKLIFINMMIIIISLMVIGGLLYSNVTSYVINSRTDIMEENAEYLAETALFSIDSDFDIINQYYEKVISVAADNANSIVLIVDSNGQVVVASSPYNIALRGRMIDKELAEEILLGKPFKKITKTSMFEEDMLTVSMPISTNSQVYGAVLFFAPTPLLYVIRYDVLTMILGAFILASLVALVLTYLFSKKLTNPLKDLNNVTKTITKGRFDKRVTVSTNDEIGELAENFNYMAAYLENLEEVRSSFVANVSHELRTPMTTIGGFIDAIIDRTIPEEKVESYLIIIRNEIKRLSRLVNDLLEISRSNMLHEKLAFDEFDINELVRLTIIKFEQKIEEKELDVMVDMQDGKLMVHSNKDAMERVLTNLIDNAVKFANQGGEIGVKVFESGKMIGVTITNTGSYIAPDEIKYVWDRFYKADKSRGKDKSGAGLGLYIVKNLVEACNGNIFVKSTKERTEFTFKISK